MKKILKIIDMKSGFFDPALPSWVIVIILAVVIAAGFIAWAITH